MTPAASGNRATAGGPAILEIEGLGHHFVHDGATVPVLRELSLAVRCGELVCLIGRSGCGKSTLLKIVAGFLTPTTGRCRLDGRPIGRPGPDRAARRPGWLRTTGAGSWASAWRARAT